MKRIVNVTGAVLHLPGIGAVMPHGSVEVTDEMARQFEGDKRWVVTEIDATDPVTDHEADEVNDDGDETDPSPAA